MLSDPGPIQVHRHLIPGHSTSQTRSSTPSTMCLADWLHHTRSYSSTNSPIMLARSLETRPPTSCHLKPMRPTCRGMSSWNAPQNNCTHASYSWRDSPQTLRALVIRLRYRGCYNFASALGPRAHDF